MSKSNKRGNLVEGLLIGGAIGGIAGLLLAPRDGKHTRQIVKKSAEAIPEIIEDVASNLQEQTNRFSSLAKRNWKDTITRFRVAIAVGIETSQVEAEQMRRPQENDHDKRVN